MIASLLMPFKKKTYDMIVNKMIVREITLVGACIEPAPVSSSVLA
jgi:hypothetical protein